MNNIVHNVENRLTVVSLQTVCVRACVRSCELNYVHKL